MIKIKEASLEYIQPLSKLFDGYRIFYGRESDIPLAKNFLKERIQSGDSQIYMAFYNDLVAGFVQLYPLFSSVKMQRLWLLNDLFVDPNFRGKGISKALIEQAKELCRETNAYGMMLETEKLNKIGNELYPKAGFKIDKEHNFYNWITE